MASLPNNDLLTRERSAMVSTQLRARGIRDERVLAAMERIPRHEFVSPEFYGQAYEDCPLPIGEGQTISQPYIVALMLEALAIGPNDIVLEIGTGSGYATALLAELAARVYSVERIEDLAATAERNLRRMGYHNVDVIVADGSEGLARNAPYHAILVSAAAPRVPKPLIQQLAEGGRMVIPVGGPVMQELNLVRKVGGQVLVKPAEGCRFVPLIGAQGFSGGR